MRGRSHSHSPQGLNHCRSVSCWLIGVAADVHPIRLFEQTSIGHCLGANMPRPCTFCQCPAHQQPMAGHQCRSPEWLHRVDPEGWGSCEHCHRLSRRWTASGGWHSSSDATLPSCWCGTCLHHEQKHRGNSHLACAMGGTHCHGDPIAQMTSVWPHEVVAGGKKARGRCRCSCHGHAGAAGWSTHTQSQVLQWTVSWSV